MLRLTFLLICTPFLLIAQKGNSPLSGFGLGDPIADEYNYNSAMGGITTGVISQFHINSNPAFLPYNKYTTFMVGLTGEYKQLTSTRNSVSDGNGNLRYLAFSFPISRKYTMSLGIKPLTRVNYDYSQSSLVQGSADTVRYTFKGNGGINNFYWSHGVQVTKSIGLGLKLGYVFGSIEKMYDSYILFKEDPYQQYILESNYQTNYRGFVIAPSIGLAQKLNDDWYLNAGASYEIGNNWNYTNSHVNQKIALNGQSMDYDTVRNEITGSITHPSTLTFGVSIERRLKWLIGAEIRTQDWSGFKSIDNSDAFKTVNSVSLGGQFIPDISAMKGYLNRVVYRFGVYYNQSKLAASGNDLNDYGASIGFDFPVGRTSFINLALSGGKRGDKNVNIIEENYFRINLGITLNDRWFVRSKFD